MEIRSKGKLPAVKGFPLLVNTFSSKGEVGVEVEDEVDNSVSFMEEKLTRKREKKSGKE